jgi:CheY-like chemotaxis protein
MPIIGFSELLLSDPAALDDRKEARHMIDMILSAGNDARQIVRRLRTVYRKDDDAEYETIDIAKNVESAISLTMPKWKEEMSSKNVAIEMATDFHPVPQIRGNASELREALTNLIFNATDAMPKGGVITFRLYCENNVSVVLEVTDTGVGMDYETLRHCMEPFFTTKGVQGSGLGLSMVHGILERHGGTVEIESKPGAGTTIRMRFPVPVEAERTEKKSKTKPKRLPPRRVLTIDDEARSRDLIAALLKSDGHYVETAGGGREGLDLLRVGKFDLIITDSAMPLMSGDEVAGEAQKIRPGIPVIMLTGFGDIMKDIGKCPAGVARVMSKPVTSGELRLAMAAVLNAEAPQLGTRKSERGKRGGMLQ